MDMHEWALAEAVSSLVFEKVKRPLKVSIKLGELQNVDEDIFLLALNELLNGVEMSFEREKCLLLCNACGCGWDLSSLSEEERELVHFLPEAIHSYTVCPSCGSMDFSVEKGRGVTVEKIEGCDGS